MSTKFILSVLRIATNILFYFLIVVFFFMLAKDAYSLYDKNPSYIGIDKSDYFKNSNGPKPIDLFSADKKIRYQTVTNLFTVEADTHSQLSYYYMFYTLISIGLGLLLLWNFKKLFEGINMQQPFKSDLVKRLKLLAFIFIITDFLGLIHYFIVNSLIQQSLQNPKLHLSTDSGEGIITGLIILVIAMVYQRGVEIEEESSLTV